MDQPIMAKIEGLIDLRAAHRQDRFAAAPFVAGDNFGLYRRGLVLDAEEGFETGAVAMPAGSGMVASATRHELVIVVEGRIRFGDDPSLDLSTGDSAVIPRGSRFAWSAPEKVSWIYASHAGSPEDVGLPTAPLRILPERPTGASAGPPPELVLTGSPVVWHQNPALVTKSGKFGCGVWDTTPYRRDFTIHPRHELMYLLEGSVSFIPRQGLPVTFKRGDILMMTRGTETSWSNAETCRKIFCNLK
jgi:uncharacterized cupin superfamily protein